MKRGAVLVAISGLSYGTVAIFGKLAFGLGIPLATLLALRFALAAIFLWCAVFALRKELVPAARLPLVVSLGIFWVLQATTYFTSLQTIPASMTSLLLFTFPAFVTLADHFLGESLTWLRAGTVAAALLGTALVIAAPAQALAPAGVAFGLLSALFYGGFILVGSRVLRGLPATASTATLVTTTALCFALAAFVRHDAPPPASGAALLVVAGIVVFSTIVPILSQIDGMPEIGASRAAIIGTVEPLMTVVLAMLFLHDRVTPLQVAGGALILVSIVVREGSELLRQPRPRSSPGQSLAPLQD
ncbi:MAG: DMT family transporter [Candidatus Baltobacteraceae bacterium]|jgi:drug/metabolite transporter (DMT)-like permease